MSVGCTIRSLLFVDQINYSKNEEEKPNITFLMIKKNRRIDSFLFLVVRLYFMLSTFSRSIFTKNRTNCEHISSLLLQKLDACSVLAQMIDTMFLR